MNKYEMLAEEVELNFPGTEFEIILNIRRGPKIRYFTNTLCPNIVTVRRSNGIGGWDDETYTAPEDGGFIRDSCGKQIGAALKWDGKENLINAIRNEIRNVRNIAEELDNIALMALFKKKLNRRFSRAQVEALADELEIGFVNTSDDSKRKKWSTYDRSHGEFCQGFRNLNAAGLALEKLLADRRIDDAYDL